MKYKTQRLLLREWRDEDVEPFSLMNADPRVMEYFPNTLSEDESQGMVRRIHQHFEANGYGLWAVEIPGVCPFIGFVGLQIPRFESPFMPCVEIGWRLAADYWGQGFATEAAFKSLDIGFGQLGLDEIVSMTAVINTPSRRVMEKIGMRHDSAGDFNHPKVPPQSRIYPHVLYRLKAADHPVESKE